MQILKRNNTHPALKNMKHFELCKISLTGHIHEYATRGRN